MKTIKTYVCEATHQTAKEKAKSLGLTMARYMKLLLLKDLKDFKKPNANA